MEVPGSGPVTPTTFVSRRQPRMASYFLRQPLGQVVTPLGCSLATPFFVQLIRLAGFTVEVTVAGSGFFSEARRVEML